MRKYEGSVSARNVKKGREKVEVDVLYKNMSGRVRCVHTGVTCMYTDLLFWCNSSRSMAVGLDREKQRDNWVVWPYRVREQVEY